MKEKLIAFIRNEKNYKKMRRNYVLLGIVLIAFIVAILVFKVELQNVIMFPIFLLFLIIVLVHYAIEVLFSVSEVVIRLNPVALILFSNRDFIDAIVFELYMIAIILYPRSFVISVIFLIIFCTNSGKISEHFRKQLKK